jgi:hypothetical protein
VTISHTYSANVVGKDPNADIVVLHLVAHVRSWFMQQKQSKRR